jgi:hypothetical protein
MLLDFLLGLILDQNRETKIDDFDLEGAGGQPREHDVGRLEIAVDHVHFLCGDERFERLRGYAFKIMPDERCGLNDFIEGFAIDKLHHHIRTFFVFSYVENGDNVRMLQRGQRADLGHELLDRLRL